MLFRSESLRRYLRYSWFFLRSAMSFVNSGLMVRRTSVVARPSASNAAGLILGSGESDEEREDDWEDDG